MHFFPNSVVTTVEEGEVADTMSYLLDPDHLPKVRRIVIFVSDLIVAVQTRVPGL